MIVIFAKETVIFIQKLAQKCGKCISMAFPVLEVRGSKRLRIALAFGEVPSRGSSFTIGKPSGRLLTITQLIDYGTLSPLMATYF